MIIIVLLILIIAIIILLLKINQDLIKCKDLILRNLAAVDAQLLRRNDILAYFLPLVNENMLKEKTLIADIFALRAEVVKLRPKLNNTEKRFELQELIDTKLSYLLTAINRYLELKNNLRVAEGLKDLSDIEEKLAYNIKCYNDTVTNLQNMIELFPSNIIAKLTKTKCKLPYYKRASN